MASIDEGVDSIQATPDVTADLGSVNMSFLRTEIYTLDAVLDEYRKDYEQDYDSRAWTDFCNVHRRVHEASLTAGASPANQRSLEPNLPSEIARLRKALEEVVLHVTEVVRASDIPDCGDIVLFEMEQIEVIAREALTSTLLEGEKT